MDINNDDFADEIGCTASLVIATAVWEHVLHPDRFVHNLLRLLAPDGLLYLMTPNYGSLASRVLGRRWPYFEPGEHLNMPTPLGARRCLLRQWTALHEGQRVPLIHCAPLFLPYTLRYAFKRFGMHAIGRLFPRGLALPLPAGILEAVLISPASSSPDKPKLGAK